MIQEKIYIYGKHALIEALTNTPHAVKKVFLAERQVQDKDDAQLRELLKANNIVPSVLGGNTPTDIEQSASHQGVIGLISLTNLVVPYKEFADKTPVTKDTALVLLGELQDPHNVGAIIRSAAAFGVSGILIPEHNQAPITGTVVKVSAGMAFRIPLVSIGNVNTTLIDLKKHGFWIYGLAGEGAHNVSKEKFDAPAVFVVGNESDGIREKTRELCDILISIPMNPRCESLNAAASAAVVLYAWSAQHPDILK